MKKINDLLVIDVESTCWQKEQKGKSEIIEVGFTTIENKEVKDNGYLWVQPTTSKISNFCTHLTGITKEDVEGELTFSESCEWLRDRYYNRHNVWASWGLYDKRQFERQCKREDLRYPLPYQHLNIKALFGAKYGYLCSVEEACDLAGIEFEGQPHRGYWDSYNIAKLLISCI